MLKAEYERRFRELQVALQEIEKIAEENIHHRGMLVVYEKAKQALESVEQ